MISNLTINNIAVIDKVNVEFESGFNVLTGETGAGKSIIIDSLNILKGERASKTLIRSGEGKAKVSAVISVPQNVADFIINSFDIEVCDNEIMVSREITADGKNNIRINGEAVTLSVLKQIGDMLINIHGQHDNTALLAKKNHISYLDEFAGDDIYNLLNEYMEVHKSYLETGESLNNIQTDNFEKARRVEMLNFQCDEIARAKLVSGEEEQLDARHSFITNIQEISNAVTGAYANIFEGSEYTPSAHDLLWDGINMLEKVERFDADISDIRTALADAGYIIDDKMRELKRLCDGLSYDDRELKEIEARLELIYNLKMKYGNSIEDILAYYEKISDELENLENSEQSIKLLEKQLNELETKRFNIAKKITEVRKNGAKRLASLIMKELCDLEMDKVKFEVQINPCDYNLNGADDVEFLICTNVGEGFKELSKIASGGELSRVMLAIKSVLLECDGAQTAVFDEIDTGVSGRTARAIGEKLIKISRNIQVICITHLPQISSLADSHFLIQKNVEDERTKTSVKLLDRDERITEVARTLGGAEITDITLKNAEELVLQGEKLKTGDK